MRGFPVRNWRGAIRHAGHRAGGRSGRLLPADKEEVNTTPFGVRVGVRVRFGIMVVKDTDGWGAREGKSVQKEKMDGQRERERGRERERERTRGNDRE